jgi:sulfur carrier protein
MAAYDIELNGAPYRLEQSTTLQDLVAALDLAGKALAVAVNRQVVPRQRWSEHALQEADKVDIVRAIGGG